MKNWKKWLSAGLLAAVLGAAGISAPATEFSLVTLAIVFAAIITENALCGAYLGKNKHSKKYDVST